MNNKDANVTGVDGSLIPPWSWTYTLLGTGVSSHDYSASVIGWDRLWLVDTILRQESLTSKSYKEIYIAARCTNVNKQ